MTDISLSNKNMQYINMAAKVTNTIILDCIIKDNLLVFIVGKGCLGAAIGRKAKNLEKLKNMFKKNIKFVENDEDKVKFIHNLFKPYDINKVTFEGNEENPIAKVQVKPSDKSKIIGKGGRNIEIIRKLAHRHQNIKDVQIK